MTQANENAKYDFSEPFYSPEKDRVLDAICAAMTLEACAEARNLRSAYLREHPLDWAVLSAANMLDAAERALQQAQSEKGLQPKLSHSDVNPVP